MAGLPGKICQITRYCLSLLLLALFSAAAAQPADEVRVTLAAYTPDNEALVQVSLPPGRTVAEGTLLLDEEAYPLEIGVGPLPARYWFLLDAGGGMLNAAANVRTTLRRSLAELDGPVSFIFYNAEVQLISDPDDPAAALGRYTATAAAPGCASAALQALDTALMGPHVVGRVLLVAGPSSQEGCPELPQVLPLALDVIVIAAQVDELYRELAESSGGQAHAASVSTFEARLDELRALWQGPAYTLRAPLQGPPQGPALLELVLDDGRRLELPLSLSLLDTEAPAAATLLPAPTATPTPTATARATQTPARTASPAPTRATATAEPTAADAPETTAEATAEALAPPPPTVLPTPEQPPAAAPSPPPAALAAAAVALIALATLLLAGLALLLRRDRAVSTVEITMPETDSGLNRTEVEESTSMEEAAESLDFYAAGPRAGTTPQLSVVPPPGPPAPEPPPMQRSEREPQAGDSAAAGRFTLASFKAERPELTPEDELMITQVISDEAFTHMRQLIEQIKAGSEEEAQVLAWLRLGGSPPRDFEVRKPQSTIGRGEDCDVVIAGDSAVSAAHARLEKRADGGFWLAVVSGTNPVIVSGVLLAPGSERQLRSHDVIQLSPDTRLVFIPRGQSGPADFEEEVTTL